MFGDHILRRIFGAPILRRMFGAPILRRMFGAPILRRMFGAPILRRMFGAPILRRMFGAPICVGCSALPSASDVRRSRPRRMFGDRVLGGCSAITSCGGCSALPSAADARRSYLRRMRGAPILRRMFGAPILRRLRRMYAVTRGPTSATRSSQCDYARAGGVRSRLSRFTRACAAGSLSGAWVARAPSRRGYRTPRRDAQSTSYICNYYFWVCETRSRFRFRSRFRSRSPVHSGGCALLVAARRTSHICN